MDINESTVRRFKEAYLKERSRKRQVEDDDVSVNELPVKKRGRKVVLGTKMDNMVQQYILKLRETGSVINTAVVISGARGILQSQDRTRLAEFGGPATLTTAWTKSLLRRMNFTKTRGTTKSKLPVEEFNKLKASFLQDIVDNVTMEEIPPQLIFNWDQTGLNLVPVASWTMELKGSKRVEIKGLDDKRQITGVFCGTLVGEFLPIQLIYDGKTYRCHPPYPFPVDWDITHNPNHWSNEKTMLEYIDNIIVPFVDRVKKHLKLGKEQATLAIFDHFRGQLTAQVTDLLEKHNIQAVLVPACCTDRLQPLDISVNKAAKSFLRSEFQQWYSNEITQQLNSMTCEDEIEPVDLSSAKMKCIGAQWLVRLFEYLSDSPSIIVNGFLAANIAQSIDAGKPILEEESILTSSSDDEVTESEGDNDHADIDMFN